MTTMKAGLINCTSDKEVPLKEIQNHVYIKGFIANVHSTLLYQNNESDPIEAKFVFPMHDQSCVYKFEAEIEGRKIVAEIQEKTQAEETYQDAIASNQTAMMMSEDDQSGDIFEIKLGNLPANTEAKLTLGYVRELTVESDGTVVFILPTQLNPRYTPAGSPPTLDSKVPYVSSSSIHYTMTFTAKIEGNAIIEQVYSKTEKLKVEKSEDGKTAMAELDESFKFDHDLSLEVKYQSNDEPQVILEQKVPNGDGLLKEDVLMLNYFPEFKDEAKVKGEYVFIIDRSGSMGSKIKHAKETLMLLIKSLPRDCMFNIIGFGTSYKSLFDKSKLYGKESLDKATEYQESLNADMGGTEILQPLKYVYSVDVQPTYSRQIFLLTDGEVSNTHEVIALVKQNAKTTRVFSFGIGSGASTSLVEGVAKVSNGRPTYVSGNDRLQSKVISALKCSMEPSITDIELEWNLPEGLTATNIPSKLPMVVNGEKLILYAIIQGQAQPGIIQESSLKLKGKREGRNIEHTKTFDLSSAAIKDELVPLHRLAAKAQIKELEYDLNLQKSSFKPEDQEKKNKVILISMAASVLSNYTAFVGIDRERGEPVQGKIQKKYIPQPDPRCKRSIQHMQSSSLDMLSTLKSRREPNLQQLYLQHLRVQQQLPMDNELLVKMADSPNLYYEIPINSVKIQSKLMDLIDLQTFEGSWTLTKELASVIEKTVEEIKKANPIKNELVWTTALAVAWLRLKQSSKRDEWELIERKALQWISQQNLEGKSRDEILGLASSYLSGPSSSL